MEMVLEKLDISVILFDLDNTLIDTKGSDKVACEEVCRFLQDAGVKKPQAQEVTTRFYESVRVRPHDPAKKRSDVDRWRTMLWSEALGPKLMSYAEKAYSLWKEVRMQYLTLSPEVEDVLVQLKETYRLGLITNGASVAQWEKVHRINGHDYFDSILVGGDYPKEKPDPFIFEVAFRMLDVSPKECIMVGDKLETDIQGGVNAGVAATVWIPGEDCSWDNPVPKPDFQIKHVCELLDLLPEPGKLVSRAEGSSIAFEDSFWREDRALGRKMEW